MIVLDILRQHAYKSRRGFKGFYKFTTAPVDFPFIHVCENIYTLNEFPLFDKDVEPLASTMQSSYCLQCDFYRPEDIEWVFGYFARYIPRPDEFLKLYTIPYDEKTKTFGFVVIPRPGTPLKVKDYVLSVLLAFELNSAEYKSKRDLASIRRIIRGRA